jgi:AcrR family transcriptional regulator
MRYGVRSVTMDDVARELGMSKKTLYQSFSNKDELILEVTRAHIAVEMADFNSIRENSRDAIDELHQLTHCVRHAVSNMNPSLLFDLHKYHPDAWQMFLDFKSSFIQSQVRQNIERGIKDGTYRKNLNADILAKIRMEQIQTCFDPKIFPPGEYQLLDVQMAVLDHFIHGLLTEQGHKIFHDYQTTQID